MGLFITLEGPEGSGKTTISKLLEAHFNEMGQTVCLTREPGGIYISEKIRELILDPQHEEMDAKTEALLYAASRRQHLVEKVIPALERKELVICDRFIDSSLAYQGFARGLGIDAVFEMNLFAIEDHMPDLTLFFDVSAEIGMSRIGVRGYKDRLELAGDEFHQNVYKGYKKIVSMYPERIKVLDANQDIETVFNEALKLITEKMNESH